MSLHVMIDIETLGTKPGAALISLGAVKFDPNTDDEMDKFYTAIDPESCTRHGLRIDAATVMWWMHDDRAEARKQLMSEKQLDLVTALYGFSEWFGKESLPVWGNGATFDNVLLRIAFEATGIDPPWKYHHDRCYRTLKSLVPSSAIIAPANTIEHHALNDAVFQAEYLRKVWQMLDVVI